MKARTNYAKLKQGIWTKSGIHWNDNKWSDESRCKTWCVQKLSMDFSFMDYCQRPRRNSRGRDRFDRSCNPYTTPDHLGLWLSEILRLKRKTTARWSNIEVWQDSKCMYQSINISPVKNLSSVLLAWLSQLDIQIFSKLAITKYIVVLNYSLTL